jgi:hypothetical protein
VKTWVWRTTKGYASGPQPVVRWKIARADGGFDQGEIYWGRRKLARLDAIIERARRVETPAARRRLLADVRSLRTTEGRIPARPRSIRPHAKNMFSALVVKLADLRVLAEELDKQAPMENWPAANLDEWLENFRPIEDRIALAKRLRDATGK